MPTQDTGQIGTGNRPQTTNRIGNREGVYLDVFTLRWGEFFWTLGLSVAATMIAVLVCWRRLNQKVISIAS